MFRRLFSEFPLADINLRSERPDLLVKSAIGVLGIEHTKLFKNKSSNIGNSTREIYGSQKRVLKKARIICEQKGIPPLWVKVLFNIVNSNFRRKDIDHIAESLTNLIQLRLSEVKKKGKVIIKPGDISTQLPEIRHIDITYGIIGETNWLPTHRWEVVMPSWVRKNFIDDLQHCINEKNVFTLSILRNARNVGY